MGVLKMADPRFVVHTTTVIHKEYIVQAPSQKVLSTEWLLDHNIVQEGVVCEEITHIKSINDYEYHNEYGGDNPWAFYKKNGDDIVPMNDPVEGSRYELERGKEE